MDDLMLDALVILWRAVFDQTDATLDDLVRNRSSFQLSPDELHMRKQELRDERGKLELELEHLAQASRLHPCLRAPAAPVFVEVGTTRAENP